MHTLMAGDNPESHDGESQERSVTNSGQTTANKTTSSGLYDAEKCRAYIANQIRVSKIDRFAAQICKALEVEADIQNRLVNILNMYVKRSAQVTHDFTIRCKMGLQRHRQDRILNNQRKPSKGKTDNMRYLSSKQYSISNDLLYGPGAQLVHALLAQSIPPFSKHIKRKPNEIQESGRFDQKMELTPNSSGLSDDDYILTDSFEPALFVKKLGDYIRNNLRRSKAISLQLNTMRQTFEKLALEHRDKVDSVYAAEEERQAATVIRRSAYNLSVAAIKATSTPVHVNSTT